MSHVSVSLRPDGRCSTRACVRDWTLLSLGALVLSWSSLALLHRLLPQVSVLGSTLSAVAVALAALAVLGGGGLTGHRVRVETLLLALGGVVMAATALGALHGTRWGFDGLYSDAGFRTQSVTRFADSPALHDYAYADLPAYYPVLWPWLQGRVADLLAVPGWTVMKPAQVLVCLLIPALAYVLWRRVLPGQLAAGVAVATTMATAMPYKADEWLVLCLLVPWWLEVCRGLGHEDARPWGAWRHGVVLGVLLLCHTYFFAPLALATVIGFLVDLAQRRPPRPAPRPALAIGLVGLVVAAPTWWPMVSARLLDLPSDDLQRRWSPPGFDVPALPLPYDPRGVLELVGVVWLLWTARRSKMAAGLLLLLLVSYLFMVGGQLLQPLGLAVLPEKSEELSELVLVAGAVLAVPQLSARLRTGRPRLRTASVAMVAVVVLAAGASSLHRGMLEPAGPAQTMRYPDGGFPNGGAVPASPRWHPWGVGPGEQGPSVDEVQDAWSELTGRPLGQDDVIVSARADVSATVPVRLFVPWKSIYSHPQGQFEERVSMLGQVSRCPRAQCAHDLLRDNAFDRVDGLLLNRDGAGFFATVTLDNFPEGWTASSLRFRPGLFDSSRFDVVLLPGAALVHLRS